jgi:hypothetical protein
MLHDFESREKEEVSENGNHLLTGEQDSQVKQEKRHIGTSPFTSS